MPHGTRSGCPQVNTSPEFKGIKTPGSELQSVRRQVNTSPEFKGIKTLGMSYALS